MEEMPKQQPVPVIQEALNQIPEASGSVLDLRSVPEDTVPAVVQTQGIEPEEAKLPGGTRSLVRAVTSPLRLIGWLVAQMV